MNTQTGFLSSVKTVALTTAIAVTSAYSSITLADQKEAYWPPAEENTAQHDITINHVGSAMRYHGNKPMYMASLYSEDSFPNTAVLYSNDGSKALKLVIMNEAVSYRRIKRTIKNDLAISLTTEEYIDLQPEINALLTALKGDYHLGTLVDISYDSLKDTTEIQLDSQAKTTIEGKSMFNALLRSWVGQRPPSRAFKEALLGDIAPVIDISLEKELLLTEYMERQINPGIMSYDADTWVVSTEVDM